MKANTSLNEVWDIKAGDYRIVPDIGLRGGWRIANHKPKARIEWRWFGGPLNPVPGLDVACYTKPSR